MAAIVWADVLGLAPELSTVSTLGQTDILAYVETLDYTKFSDDEGSPIFRLARIYLAAHLGTITLQGGAGAAGPVTQESVGGISRSYGQPFGGVAPGSLDSTAYGKAYRMIVRRTIARAPVVL